MPLNWATTQNNLGLALWRLGERESGTERLEEAVAAYLAALEERTRERVPLQWAVTQMNLANVVGDIGVRTGVIAKFDDALDHYDNAIAVFIVAAPYHAQVLERNKAITIRQREEALAKGRAKE